MAHLPGADEAGYALEETFEFNIGVCSVAAAHMVGSKR